MKLSVLWRNHDTHNKHLLLAHDLRADVSQCVRNLTGRCVAPEHVTHVASRRPVTRHVREVSATRRETGFAIDQEFELLIENT